MRPNCARACERWRRYSHSSRNRADIPQPLHTRVYVYSCSRGNALGEHPISRSSSLFFYVHASVILHHLVARVARFLLIRVDAHGHIRRGWNFSVHFSLATAAAAGTQSRRCSTCTLHVSRWGWLGDAAACAWHIATSFQR